MRFSCLSPAIASVRSCSATATATTTKQTNNGYYATSVQHKTPIKRSECTATSQEET